MYPYDPYRKQGNLHKAWFNISDENRAPKMRYDFRRIMCS